MEWVLLWLGLAVAAGVIASSKGRSGIGYFILGLLLPLISVLIAIGVSSVRPVATIAPPAAKTMVDCHACGGPRLADSKKCSHCGAPKFDAKIHMKKCPSCAEPIRKEALRCRHCGADVGVGAIA